MSFFGDTELRERLDSLTKQIHKNNVLFRDDLDVLRKDFEKEIDYIEKRLNLIDNGIMKRLNDLYAEVQTLKNNSYSMSNSLTLIESKIYFEQLEQKRVQVLLPVEQEDEKRERTTTISSEKAGN